MAGLEVEASNEGPHAGDSCLLRRWVQISDRRHGLRAVRVPEQPGLRWRPGWLEPCRARSRVGSPTVSLARIGSADQILELTRLSRVSSFSSCACRDDLNS